MGGQCTFVIDHCNALTMLHNLLGLLGVLKKTKKKQTR